MPVEPVGQDQDTQEGVGGPRRGTAAWIAVDAVLGLAAFAAIVQAALAARAGGWGDDYALYADALRGVSWLEPVSFHVRPIVRMHFALGAWLVPMAGLRLVSIALHLAAAVALGLVVRRLYTPRTARTATLAFLALPLADEAFLWASAAGVLYAALFVALAALAWHAGRPVLAGLALAAAAGSYELWIVALPLFFFLRRGRAWEWIAPGVVAVGFAVLWFSTLNLSAAAGYGGLDPLRLPVRLGIYAARFVSPAFALPEWACALCALGVAALALVRALRPAVALYFAAALVFAPSAYVASRFHYLPLFALVTLVAVPFEHPSPRRAVVPAAILAIGIATAPFLLAADVRDYTRLATINARAADVVKPPLDRVQAGATIGFANRTSPAPLVELQASLEGRAKLVFVRENALFGAVALRDAVDLALAPRGLRSVELPSCAVETRLEIGDGPPQDRYCFTVAE